jgi:Flp pilus assembly protein TadG
VNRDRGQATVELALALPFLCMLVMGVVQVAVVGRDRLAVQLAAREAARAAVVSTDARAAAAAGVAAVRLNGVDVVVHDQGASVRAVATYTDPTDVPLVGLFIPDITVTAEVTMAVEPP